MSLLYDLVDAVDRPPTFLLRAREIDEVVVVSLMDGNEQDIRDWCSQHNLSVSVVDGNAIIYRQVPSVTATLSGDLLAVDTTDRSKIILLRNALNELVAEMFRTNQE